MEGLRIQKNKRTGELRHSTDGGATWMPGPPSQNPVSGKGAMAAGMADMAAEPTLEEGLKASTLPAMLLGPPIAGAALGSATLGNVAVGAGIGAMEHGTKGALLGGLSGAIGGPIITRSLGAVLKSALARKAIGKLLGGRFLPGAAEEGANVLSSGEARRIVQNLAKAEPGAVMNPDPAVVAKMMTPKAPEGVSQALVDDLIKTGFAPEQAAQVAKAAVPNPATVLAPSSASATPAAAAPTSLAERTNRAIQELGGNPFEVAAQEIPDRLAGTGHGSGATVEEILESLKRAQKIQKALETSGKTVIAP